MCSRKQGGFTLIEMVIAIVIISIGLAGVLLALNTTVRSSADPLIRKQMQVIAEEMLEEALLRPFAVIGMAPRNKASKCSDTPPPARTAFDDISDYNAYQTTGICDFSGAAVNGLGSYDISVAVTATDSLGNKDSGGAINSSDTRQVTVTVTHGTEHFALTGFRTRYAQ